jgi:hypothetical protein
MHTEALPRDLPEGTTESSGALERELVERVRTQPYQTLLVAVGVGYVLGGGLFSSLTAHVVVTGLRAALLPLVQVGLDSAVRGALVEPSGELR